MRIIRLSTILSACFALSGCQLCRDKFASPSLPPAASTESSAVFRGSAPTAQVSALAPLPVSVLSVSSNESPQGSATVSPLLVEAFRPIQPNGGEMTTERPTAATDKPAEAKPDVQLLAKIETLAREVERLKQERVESDKKHQQAIQNLQNQLQNQQPNPLDQSQSRSTASEAKSLDSRPSITDLNDPFATSPAIHRPVASDAFSAIEVHPVSKATSSEPPKIWKPVFDIPGLVVISEPGVTRMEMVDSALFNRETWELHPRGEEALRKIAAEIKTYDVNALVEIEGHTDNIVIDPSNSTQKHDLSSHKTFAVMQYFVKTMNWDSHKIKTSNFGANRPVADNGSAEGRNRNNRIEIVVTPSDAAK